MRDDEHVYGLGEKNPLYVSVPFYIVLRKGVAFGIFLDNTFRSNFDIGHLREGVLSFGSDGGALDYYFIYGPDPKEVIERYTTLTGRMPLPPLCSLGYHQCRYSYYPDHQGRLAADQTARRFERVEIRIEDVPRP